MSESANTKGRKRGLDSIISKLKQSAPDGSSDNLPLNPLQDENKGTVDSGPETEFAQKKSKRKSEVKVRYKRINIVDSDDEVDDEEPAEAAEEQPEFSPNGALQSSDEEMISVIHTSHVKVEPVVDKEYDVLLEGLDKVTGMTVVDVDKTEAESKTKHKTSKHKHHHHHHKKKNDFLENEDGLPRRVDCTVCGRQMDPKHGTISRHPFLNVLVCKKCVQYYNSGPFTRDEFGIEEQCRWCGDGGALICCDNCDKAFCKPCIRRNLGRSFLKALEEAPDDQEWKCFCCDPSPLAELVKKAHMVMRILEVQKDERGLFKSKNETSLTSGPKQRERRKRLASLTENITVKTEGILSPGVSPVKKTFSSKTGNQKQRSDNSDSEKEDLNDNNKEENTLGSKDTVNIETKKRSDEDSIIIGSDDDENDHNDGIDDEISENLQNGVSKSKKNKSLKSVRKIDVKDRKIIVSDESGDYLNERRTKNPSKSKNDKNKANEQKGSRSGSVVKGKHNSYANTFNSNSDSDVSAGKKSGRKTNRTKRSNKNNLSDDLSDNESDNDDFVKAKSNRKKQLKRRGSSESDENIKEKASKRNRKKGGKTRNMKKVKDHKLSNDSESDQFSDFVSMAKQGNKKNNSGKHKQASSDDESDKIGRKSSKRKRFLSAKRTRKRRRRFSFSSNSDNSESDFSVRKRRQKKRRTHEDTSDSESEFSEGEKRRQHKKGKGRKTKVRRKKKEEDELESENSDSVDESSPTKRKKGRKDIRKLLGEDKLAEETKRARKLEEERRKRLLERTQQVYEEEALPGLSSTVTKLVLEADPETKEPIVEVKEEILQYMKPHQVKGVQFLYDCTIESVQAWKKSDPGGGCILAHCMGLGKTLQVVALIHTLHNNQDIQMKSALVVAPLNTVLNWQVEFEKWLCVDDRLEVYVLTEAGSSNWRRADMIKQWHRYGGVMIMGYDAFRNLSQGSRIRSKHQKKIFTEGLVDPGPDMVVCDEGHILRNDATAISKALNAIKTKRRIVLTGTPLQNNLIEYHCMVSFVKPNLLGTRKEFQNTFANPIQNGQCADSTPVDVRLMKQRCHVLHKMLEGCVQRRDYSVLTPFLPPKHEYVIFVRLSNKQRQLYKHYLDTFVYSGEGVSKKGLGLFSDYQALMRIWTHPWTMKLEALRRPEKFADSDSLDDFVVYSDEESEHSSTSEDNSMMLSDSESDVSTSSRGRHNQSSSDDDDDDDDGSDSDIEEAPPPVSQRSTEKATGPSSKSINGENKDGSSKQVDSIEVVDCLPATNEDSKNGAFGSTRSGADFKGGVADVVVEEEKEWYDEFLSEEDESNIELSGKLVILLEILADAEAVGEKVIVFSQSLVSLDLIEKALGGGKINGDRENWCRGCDYFRMDGSTSAHLRQRWADIFNDIDNTSARLFLISTKAGGVGINLVAANRVVVFDASWNPSHDVQSIFRVYRFGQLKPVYIYRLLAQGTMEEKIYERQITKLSVSQRVVDEHQIERHFTANDLAELYAFNAEEYVEEQDQHTNSNTDTEHIVQQEVAETSNVDITQAKEGGKTDNNSINKEENTEREKEGKEESREGDSCNTGASTASDVQPSKESNVSTTTSTQQRPSLPLPKDAVLADLINRLHPKWIIKYHVHDSLLQNIEEETLTEEEMKAAWDAYEAEKNNVKTAPAPVTSQAQQYNQYLPAQQLQQLSTAPLSQGTSTQQNANSASITSLNDIHMIQQMHQIKLVQEWERRRQLEKMQRMRQGAQDTEELQRRVLLEMQRGKEQRFRENQMRLFQNQTPSTGRPRLPIPPYQPSYQFMTAPTQSSAHADLRATSPNLVTVLRHPVLRPQVSLPSTTETQPNSNTGQLIRINVDENR